ncbi:MAG: ectonucleotide pyrophosphatase/phosphodiesterase [Myxococcota bacterium]|nr:ectonucleotide pyrophosphatase/phosphodiesterase [Myxococcota bacterium]
MVSLAASNALAEPTVIVLSWDGVRYDYLDRSGLPALERMQRHGARAERLIPPFPSSTFPGHVTLATGAPVDRHGIVSNKFFDPALGPDAVFDYGADARWIDAEPLWAAAERQGVRSAVFFWVGSETDWRGRGATLRMAPFDSGVPERKKVDQILAWLDLPEAERPRLIMAYWRGADHAGHRHGPDSKDVHQALRSQDAQLGRLLAGLDSRAAWSDTTLLIVSDHGMIAVSQPLDARRLLREAGVAARVVHATALALVYLRDPSDSAARRRAIEALSAPEGVSAYPSDQLPAPLRYAHSSRLGQVVAIATPPRMFRSGARGVAERALRALGGSTGGHGYDPIAVREMSGIFVALGRGVGTGVRLPPARAIDLAPTVASLLGIEPPEHSEGSALDLTP